MSRRPTPARRHWHPWTETEATAVPEAFATAGLNTADFFAQRGFLTGCLKYWRQGLAASPTTVTPAFVAVTLPISRRPDAHIERGGLVLRVREDIDVEHLARLVDALAGAPC